MEIFGFVLSVWAAIAFGIFVLAMIVSCTFDRYDNIAPKWWVLFLGMIAYVFFVGPAAFTWQMFLARDLWVMVGGYLAIGLGYSLIEFFLNVRRSAKRWAESWTSCKTNESNIEKFDKEAAQANDNIRRKRLAYQGDASDLVKEEPITAAGLMAATYVEQNTRNSRSGEIISIRLGTESDESPVVPYVRRFVLARHVSAWTIFWPFYAISLIIGDLLTQIFRIIADIIVYMSGRMVKRMFKNVFKM